jgi:hypothetical protein
MMNSGMVPRSNLIKGQVAIGMAQAVVPVQEAVSDGDLLQALEHQADHLCEMTKKG